MIVNTVKTEGQPYQLSFRAPETIELYGIELTLFHIDGNLSVMLIFQFAHGATWHRQN